MAKDTKAKKEPESAETQESAPPAEEQKTPAKTEEAPETKAKVEEAKPEEVDLGLPEEASDRTRKRVKTILDENKALKQKLEQRKSRETLFESMKPPAKVEPKPEDFVNPQTGEVDLVKFNQAITEAKVSAQRAQQAVRKFEEQQQEREAIAAYPQLAKDERLRKITSAVILDSMVDPDKYGGKTLTATQAAKIAIGEEKKKTEEAIGRREEASEVEAGRSDRRAQVEPELEELQRLTRGGEGIRDRQTFDAITKRLEKIPPVGAAKE
jgi:hypothetical protein